MAYICLELILLFVHQNFYFLRQLAPAIEKVVKGKSFIEAFSQEKDELILVFGAQDGESDFFFIKATLRSDFASLSFPDRFDRARRNSVNLFTELYGKSIEEVRIFENERAIKFGMTGGETLVFKLFGNRSNIIHFDGEGTVKGLFNNRLSIDKQLSLPQLDRPIDQTHTAYLAAEGDHKRLFPTFGKLVNSYLSEKLAGVSELSERWSIIQSVLYLLENPTYYLTIVDLVPVLSLLETGNIQQVLHDPLEALNQFYYTYSGQSNVNREKGEMIRILKKRIRQTESYLSLNFEKLKELETARKNEEIGHILMANLHQIPERLEKVELDDFYNDQPITISLKKDLSPQKNAERYYRKAKNEKLEQDKLLESLDFRDTELKADKVHLETIDQIEVLRDLRAYIKKEGLKGTAVVASPAELFKKVEFQGFTIFIGRNAKNNDLLTKKYAHKDDLWLHARDVSGSHVVIKRIVGRQFPGIVIERAAELAAWYSKRKTDSLCPVIVTPKKYVRKPKGLPDGAVVIDKEDVVMVVPKGE